MTKIKNLVVVAGLAIGASAFGQTADSSRAYAAELVSDAGARVSLLDGGSGYDKGGFMIGSADGNNSLYVFGSAQIRYYADFRDDNNGAIENFTHGFETRLTRLGVKGSVWDKAFTYQVRGEFGAEGAFSLETAYAGYSWDNGFGILVGQLKHPLLRESMIDNEYQLAVERSVSESFFSGGYTQGLQFTYASDAFRMWTGFTDGANTANTNFGSAAEADYCLNFRGEFKAMGADWGRFDDFTSWKSSEDMGILIGAAISWQDTGETGGTNVDNVQSLTYTLDAQFEGQGWNAFASFVGVHGDSDVQTESTDDFGVVLQAGIFVTDQVELFGRWDSIFWDSARVDSNGDGLKDAHFATAGVNYYLSPESHAAKISADVIYAFEATQDIDPTVDNNLPFFDGSSNYGLLGQPDDGEFAIRTQLQVVF